jgi:hypothetical protein
MPLTKALAGLLLPGEYTVSDDTVFETHAYSNWSGQGILSLASQRA